MNTSAVLQIKGIEGPNTGDEIETGVVIEEEATTGAEVVTGAVDNVITGAVIGAGGSLCDFPVCIFKPDSVLKDLSHWSH